MLTCRHPHSLPAADVTMMTRVAPFSPASAAAELAPEEARAEAVAA